MTKQTIEVEVIPKGRIAQTITQRLMPDGETVKVIINTRKILPLRIVLEETDVVKNSNHPQTMDTSIGIIGIYHGRELREVKETDIPLTNEEPKLSLSAQKIVDEFACKIPQFVHDMKGDPLQQEHEYKYMCWAMSLEIQRLRECYGEPKLSLSVDQCRKLLSRSFNHTTEVLDIVREFIKGK